jgi:radical SAM-linked protein
LSGGAPSEGTLSWRRRTQDKREAVAVTERILSHVTRRWAIRLSVDCDARFLSHHDVLRAIERAAIRAELPLAYSQGFNPRPVMSLVPPRPVGMVSLDDLLVLTVTESIDASSLCTAINAAAPDGLRFSRPTELAAKVQPQPIAATCELNCQNIPDDVRRQLPRHVDDLTELSEWLVERTSSPSRRNRRKAPTVRTVDLRPFVTDLRLTDEKLVWTQRYDGDHTARPHDVLTLLGLDQRTDLAAVVRRTIDFVLPDGQALTSPASAGGENEQG